MIQNESICRRRDIMAAAGALAGTLLLGKAVWSAPTKPPAKGSRTAEKDIKPTEVSSPATPKSGRPAPQEAPKTR